MGSTLLTFDFPPKSSRSDRGRWRLGRESNSKDTVQPVVLRPVLLGPASLLGPSKPEKNCSASCSLRGMGSTRAGHPQSKLDLNADGTSPQKSSSGLPVNCFPKPPVFGVDETTVLLTV